MALYLTTPRLTLCPLGTRHQATVHAYASSPENTRYMVYLPNRTPEDTARFLSAVEAEWHKPSPTFYEFAVCLEDRQIGAVGLYLTPDRSSGELGWVLHRDTWGHGYATEAATAVLAYGRDTLGLRHFTATCDARNTASRRVMEKLGMTWTADGVRSYHDERGDAPEACYELRLP